MHEIYTPFWQTKTTFALSTAPLKNFIRKEAEDRARFAESRLAMQPLEFEDTPRSRFVDDTRAASRIKKRLVALRTIAHFDDGGDCKATEIAEKCR